MAPPRRARPIQCRPALPKPGQLAGAERHLAHDLDPQAAATFVWRDDEFTFMNERNKHGLSEALASIIRQWKDTGF
jgi:hypothetical protein